MGPSFEKRERTTYSCHPLKLEDFTQLWNTLGSVEGVIYLWGGKGESLEKSHELSCGGALSLVQSLSLRGKMPSLWFVTRGGIPLASDKSQDLKFSPFAGLQRTIVQEYPEATSVQIDFGMDPEDPVLEAEHLLAGDLRQG